MIRQTTTAILTVATALLVCTGHLSGLTLAPEADAYALSRKPNTVYNNERLLIKLDADASDFTRKTWIRYDLSSVPGVEDAALVLTFYDEGIGDGGDTINWDFEVFGLLDGDAGESWNEATLTWNNAPANDNDNAITADALSLGTFPLFGRTGTVVFSGATGTEVRDFLLADGDDQATFILRRNTAQPDIDNSYIHAIRSSEFSGGAGALLQITVPEPATYALLGALVPLVYASRRKRLG